MPNLHSCDICNKTFQSSSRLNRHILTHTGERPFTCSQCGKAFTQPPHLSAHMLTHTGERSYECDVCKETFVHNHHLIAHMRIHTGEKNYICQVCEKRFRTSTNRNRHVRHVHQNQNTAVMTESHEEPVGTVTSTTHTFNTGPIVTTVSHLSSHLGSARVVTQKSGTIVTTNVTQGGETISQIEDWTTTEKEVAETLIALQSLDNPAT